jgi:hypothetical protein
MLTTASTRNLIFWTYLGFFALNCGLVLVAWGFWYLQTDIAELFKQIGSVYAPPGGLIIAGLFRGGGDEKPVDLTVALAAWALIVFWNVLMVFPFAYLIGVAGPQKMGITWCGDYWKSAADMFNFLSAIPLTYFFLRNEN